MKLAGVIQFIINEHMIVVKCDAAQLPRLHAEVVDRRQKKVGKLIEIFGNIGSPYALIWNTGPERRAAGEKLYTK